MIHPEITLIDTPTGIFDIRNAGLEAAKGDFILFLDADDRLSKGSVKALADFCDTLPDDVDLVTYPIETIY